MNWSSDDVPVPDPRRVATNLLLMDLYRSEVIIFLRKKIKPGARVDVSEEDILQEMYLLAFAGKASADRQARLENQELSEQHRP